MTRYLFPPGDLSAGIRGEALGLEFLSCQRIELSSAKPTVIIQSGPEELVLACIAGEAGYACGQATGTALFKDVLYVPWHMAVSLKSRQAVFMRVGAPSDRATSFAHIRFSDVAKDARHKVFGKAEANCLRDVYQCIDDTFNASRLLMGYGEGRTGGWTVWPPHEHGDEKEELYVYFDMGESFAIQCVYETLDNPLFCGIVRDGDAVAVHHGFHPNAGCPGGRINYMYVMAARVPGQREFMALRTQKEFGDKLE